MSLTTLQTINIVIASLALIPFTVLLLLWVQTNIYEYALMASIFLYAAVSMYASVLAPQTNLLLFYQVHYWTWTLAFMAIFVYGIRIIWPHRRSPPIIWYPMIGWFSILMFLPLFWSVGTQPETSTFLIWHVPHTHSSYFPKGAGLVLANGRTIYSTGQALLMYIFSVVAVVLNLYGHIRVKSIKNTIPLRIAKSFWITALICLLSYYILGLPWVPRIDQIGVLLVVALLLFSAISLFIPEGLIFSDNQVQQAYQSNLVHHPRSIRAVDNQVQRVRSYLENLPEHLKVSLDIRMEKLRKEKENVSN
jgi:hypothetical protein